MDKQGTLLDKIGRVNCGINRVTRFSAVADPRRKKSNSDVVAVSPPIGNAVNREARPSLRAVARVAGVSAMTVPRTRARELNVVQPGRILILGSPPIAPGRHGHY